MSDPIFRSYKGLASFADPTIFDDAITDVVRLIEYYFGCLIVPVGDVDDAHRQLMAAVQVPAEFQTTWLWFNEIAHSVCHKTRFSVIWDVGFNDPKDHYLRRLKAHPSHVVGVILGTAVMRAEFGIPFSKCQISMAALFELAERSNGDPSLLLFDQTDLLGLCASYA